MTGIYLGAKPIPALQAGSAPIKRVFVGAKQIWGPTPQPVQIILTSGTSFARPADWNDANNTVECIGGGASGIKSGTFTTGAGGAGGAYAKISNRTISGSVPYIVGATGADTWFASTSTVCARAGDSGATSVGDVTFSGGADSAATGNGGGAAGPHGQGGTPVASYGGAGDAGYGGSGGIAGGGSGLPGAEWGTAGSGGGGGGGGGGGNFGGGGGGGNLFSGAGPGGPGVIVITYTPA